MLADFCVVVPVIELAVDVRDDDIVDGEDAPSVVELVCVAKHSVVKDRTTLPRRVQSTKLNVFIFFFLSLFIYFQAVS